MSKQNKKLKKGYDEQLAEYRKKIDQLDHTIVNTIARRMKVVKKVGILKRAHGNSPLDQKRWNQVLEGKKKLARVAGLDPDLIQDIYNRMHEHALDLEEKV